MYLKRDFAVFLNVVKVLQFLAFQLGSLQNVGTIGRSIAHVGRHQGRHTVDMAVYGRLLLRIVRRLGIVLRRVLRPELVQILERAALCHIGEVEPACGVDQVDGFTAGQL